MQKFLVNLCAAFFLLSAITYADDININSDLQQIQIKVNNLDFKINNQLQASSLELLSKYSTYNTSSIYDVQSLILNFAVPADFKRKFTVNDYKLKYIGKYKLKFKDSSQKYFHTYKKLLSPEINLLGKGFYKNINLAYITIQPFKYNAETNDLWIIDSLSIDIDLGTQIAQKNISHNMQYPFLINSKFADSYRISRNSYKNNKVLSSTGWYNHNTKYLRLVTKEDGISKIKAEDLIQLMPDFNNQPSKYLHLINNGIEQSMYLVNDQDSLLNTGDEIYFLASRAKGDTTWYEHYTDESSYFLYYDDSHLGKRFQIQDNNLTTSSTINRAKFRKHFEKEKNYYWGLTDQAIVTATMPGEGWYWGAVNPLGTRSICDTFKFYPHILTDSLNIALALQSGSFDASANTKMHKVAFLVNRDTVAHYATDSSGYNIYNVSIPFVQLTNENNYFELYSEDTRNPDGQLVGNDVWLDYLELEGISDAVYNNFSNYYELDRLDNNTDFQISGFRSNNIVCIDSSNNAIYFPTSSPVISFRASSINRPQAFTTIAANDSVIINSSSRGFHLCTIDLNAPSQPVYEFFTDDSQALDYINKLPEQTLVLFIYNANTDISQFFKTSIAKYGAQKINDIIVGKSSYIFAFNKGTKNSLGETVDKSGFSKLSYIQDVTNSNDLKAELKLAKNKTFNLLFSDTLNLQPVELHQVATTNLMDVNNSADYIVIYYKDFKATAQKLIDLRQKTHPNIKSMMVDAEDIYKEFGNGSKSPHFIKAFLKYAYTSWQEPSADYVTLLGDASIDPKMILSISKYPDYLPSYGNPVSDYWYAMFDDSTYLPQISISRIPIESNAEGDDFLDKLQSFESQSFTPWMKNMLMVSGGDTSQLDIFGSSMEYISNSLANSPLCYASQNIAKKSTNVVDLSQASSIINAINQGVSWVAFLGHGSASIIDFDGWMANNLSNQDRYGLFNTISCNTGAFAFPDVVARNESELLTPKKGYIMTGGSTGVGLWEIGLQFLRKATILFSTPTYTNRNMVRLFDDAKADILDTASSDIKLSNMQYCMLGDVLTSFKIDTTADLFFVDNSISITNADGDSFISESDSTIYLHGDIFNAGPKINYPINLLIIRENNGIKDSISIKINEICPNYHFLATMPIRSKIGVNNFTFIIDPENIAVENNKDNNIFKISNTVQEVSIFPVEPLPYWTINNTNPKFRITNPIADKFKFSYKFRIFSNRNQLSTPLYESNDNNVFINENYIDWEPKISLNDNTLYWLNIIVTNQNLNLTNSSYLLPFYSQTQDNVSRTVLDISGSNLVDVSNSNSGFVDNGDNKYITFKTEKVKYSAFSVNGINDALGNNIVLRNAFVSVNDTIYLVAPPAPVGITLTVIDKDLHFYSLHNFNTWGGGDPIHDSSSIKLVSYLRDSIPDGYYVFLNTCDESFRQLYVHNFIHSIGSWDTLKTVLKEYGSALVDSIEVHNKLNNIADIWKTSFVMLGQRGALPGSIPEAVNFTGDTARIDGAFDRIAKYATLTFPAIGPAKHWDHLNMNVKDIGDHNVLLKLYAYNKTTQSYPELIIQTNDFAVDLDTINCMKYDYLIPVIELKRNPEIANTKILGINAEFAPAPEIAVEKSKIAYSTGMLLGDNDSISIALKNLSLRSTLDSAVFNLTISDVSGNIDTYNFNINNLQYNQDTVLIINPSTDQYPYSIALSGIFNKNNEIPELYDFNNRLSFNQQFTPDTVKPTAILKIDNREIHGGEWVAVQPKFDIVLNDNSPLKFNNPDYINARINSIYQASDNTQNYTFTSFGKGGTKKAELTFTPDSLEFGENLIRIYLTDANQNRDTLIYRINVSRNGEIQNITNYPNPIKAGTEFSFDYAAPKQGGLAKIEIYNYNGQLIASVSNPLTIGKNTIKWNGLDKNNHSLPVGVYLYRLSISGTDVWTESITEKFLVMP